MYIYIIYIRVCVCLCVYIYMYIYMYGVRAKSVMMESLTKKADCDPLFFKYDPKLNGNRTVRRREGVSFWRKGYSDHR